MFKTVSKTIGAGIFMLALCSTGLLRAEDIATNRLGANINIKISPGPEDGRIAFKTAQMLEGLHFSHHPLDAEYGSEFLDLYLETLDPQHLHFLQSDLDGFERYRTNMNRLTLNADRKADVTPAFEIFERFIERLKQRLAYVDDLLKHEKFEFDATERVTVNRREMPYPQNMDEANKLWRQRLRFEYLQEKLGLTAVKVVQTGVTNDVEKFSNSFPPNVAPVGPWKVVTNGVAKAEVKLPDPNSATNTASAQASTNAPKSMHEQIVTTLKRRYQRSLHMFADWNNQDVMGVYLTAMAHVYDPHSDYFNKEQLDQFTINMNLALFGIGAQLRADEEGYCRIDKLLDGGPAKKSEAIKAGDRIVAVAQGDQPPVDVVDMSLNKTVQLIRGPKGTEVRLTLIPEHDMAPRTIVSLIRDEIPLPDQAAKGKLIDLPDKAGITNRLGVISLPSFYAPIGAAHRDSVGEFTSVDIAKLLKKFKQEKVGGVILDLRYNGGGSLEEAIRTTGLFIKDGPVVQVKTMDGRVIVAPDPDPSVIYDGPLIVLTSRFSASASEIVAAALQDYGRALVVGDASTHGKGTVQSVNYLTNYMRVEDPDKNNPGALKVTVQTFFRTTGVSTQLRGVLPDIVLPTVWNYSKDIGESALKHPLKCEDIEAAKYDRLDLVQPYLGDLVKRTHERLTTNKEFAYVREDIAKFQKEQEDKTISLNEKERRKEIETNEARDKARNKERLSRRGSEEIVYELSLKQAELPGLPPPVEKTNSVVMNAVEGHSMPATRTGTNPGTSTETDDEKAPVVDTNLTEAQRILIDYISLLQKRGMISSTR